MPTKMKTTSPLHQALFHAQSREHPVKLIKAAEASRLLPSAGHGSCETGNAGPRKSPEVRLVGTGPDYCDLEVVCGCGDVTRFRCWNNPPAEEKGTNK